MAESLSLTREELEATIREMGTVFDIVRTVDVSRQRVVTYTPQGKTYEQAHDCWDSWNKNGRCANCGRSGQKSK